jgi:hypothetical protein
VNILDKVMGIDSAAREVLWQLFKNGPTWDGDIASKSGRGELFRRGYAARVNGWSYLTEEGMKLSLDPFLMGDRKEIWDRERRRKS